MSIGGNIASARRAKRMSQEQLAEKLGVTFQAVSAWERDEYLPETRKLAALAAALGSSVDAILDEGPREWKTGEQDFDPDRMYTYVKAKAQGLGLRQALKALPAVKEERGKDGGDRAGMARALTLAYHALAMGIGSDGVLSALLLLGAAEGGANAEELSADGGVREALRLASRCTAPPEKGADRRELYRAAASCPLACLAVCVERCYRLSRMAGRYAREEQKRCAVETEKYVVPLLDAVRDVPEWNDAAWLLRYQILSLLETFKRVL